MKLWNLTEYLYATAKHTDVFDWKWRGAMILMTILNWMEEIAE